MPDTHTHTTHTRTHTPHHTHTHTHTRTHHTHTHTHHTHTHTPRSHSIPTAPCLQVSQDLQTHCESSITLKLNVVEARRRLEGKETSDLLRSVLPAQGILCLQLPLSPGLLCATLVTPLNLIVLTFDCVGCLVQLLCVSTSPHVLLSATSACCINSGTTSSATSQTCTHAHARTHACACTHARTHTHTHVHTHTHTHHSP